MVAPPPKPFPPPKKNRERDRERERNKINSNQMLVKSYFAHGHWAVGVLSFSHSMKRDLCSTFFKSRNFSTSIHVPLTCTPVAKRLWWIFHNRFYLTTKVCRSRDLNTRPTNCITGICCSLQSSSNNIYNMLFKRFIVSI